MFKNQFLLCDQHSQCEAEPSTTWEDFSIYVDTTDNISFSKNTISVLLIGKIVDYRSIDHTRQDIANTLASYTNLQDVIAHTDHCTGRYVLFCAVNGGIYALTDACALKRLLFGRIGGVRIMTSSECVYYSLFLDKARLNSETQSLLEDQVYQKKESPWFGLQSVDSRFHFLLPNHILDVAKLQPQRISIPKIHQQTNLQKVQEAAYILQQTFATLVDKYPLIQPLTAGWDSRCLFSASLGWKDRIKYYIFSYSNYKEEITPDIVLPKILSKDYGITFSTITPKPTSSEFLDALKKQVLPTRHLPKTDNIYHHFLHTNKKAININGNGAEIFRCYYGRPLFNSTISPLSLAYLTGVAHWKLLVNGIEAWYKISKGYAKENHITITDLFYWEQRMALWGSLYPLEQDIAIDEISPFNNRYMISLLCSVPVHWRTGPTYKVAREIVRALEPGLLTYPVNSIHATNFISKQNIKNRITAILEFRIIIGLLRHIMRR
ncbi:hypothetical protein [Candidatus Symbiobacter mobilis]|uniref:Asparagine synthetase domain-containing protein n=1 Tax=Candidatus Symbiobacter mobilis CR TaxID=946483 RepID=U5N7F7_9BURK|nr:hypothetical protein [Candidatus Symbiobacter mobilis]AGX87451.1 hypothetical protein Cenrod_1364 [Candidatus Symbiobacter mobilis CR]